MNSLEVHFSSQFFRPALKYIYICFFQLTKSGLRTREHDTRKRIQNFEKERKKLIGIYLLTPHHKPQLENPIQLRNSRIIRDTPRFPLSVNLPICPRLFPNNLPELLPCFLIMAVSQHTAPRPLAGNFASHMSSDNKRPRTRTEQAHNALGDNLLSLVVEQVKERHSVDDAKLAGEVRDERGVVIANIRLNEGRFQRIAVVKEIIADIC